MCTYTSQVCGKKKKTTKGVQNACEKSRYTGYIRPQNISFFSYNTYFFKIRLLYNLQDSLQQQKAFITQHCGTKMKC